MKCPHCNEREGTIRFIEDPKQSALAISHFPLSIPMWCERCTVEVDLEYAKKQAARVPALEDKLRRIDESH